ncbi:uncharacterized protein [Littorina saxatilis]|uniref:Uncharacterized protein n=2 Tax=Littorina saxatilis TaxID=31220 RepID=A0AAN9GBA9_9CAEN
MADNKNKTLRPSVNLFFLHSTVLFFLLLFLLLLPSPSHQNPTPDRQKRQAFDFTMNTPSTENNVSNSNGAPGLPPITNAGGLGGSLGDLVNSSGTETDDTGTGWPGPASDTGSNSSGSDPTLGGGPGMLFPNQPLSSGDNSTGNGLNFGEPSFPFGDQSGGSEDNSSTSDGGGFFHGWLFGGTEPTIPGNTSSNCIFDCGDHGVCNYTDEEKTKFYCVCDPGHVGDVCENPCGRKCSNEGSCDLVETEEKETEGNKTEGTEPEMKEVCVCPYPWVGPYCEDLPPEEVEKDNSWVYWLSGSLSVGLVVVIVAAALVIYCLWKKRLVFAMKFVYFFKSYEDNDGLLYDAFVSYVSRPEDEDFVYTHLRPKLEQEMGFKLCLHQRDFVIGETISNNICDTLENTRRFILVLTPRYLESEWAEFEYQKAFHEMLKLNIRIVPIILEEITATTTINHTLKAILDFVTYITYPGSQASQKQLDKFWEQVHLSMPKMKNKKTSTDQVESFKLTDVKISDCDVAAVENGKLPGLKNKELKEMEGLESAYLKMLDAPAKNEKPAQYTSTDPADLNHVRVDVASTGGPANIAIGSSVGEDSLRSVENHVVADTSEAKNAPVHSKGDCIPSLSAAAVTKTKSTGENKPGNTNTRTPRSKSGNILTRLLAPKKENAEAVKLEAHNPIGDSSFSQLSENQPSKCLQNGVGSNGTVNKAFDDQESSVK